MKSTKLLTVLMVLGLFTACGGDTEKESEGQSQDSTAQQTNNLPSVAPKGTLTAVQSTVEPGEEVTIRFTASAAPDNNLWVGLIPSSAPHGDASKNDAVDLSYKYLDGKSEGELVFIAPPDTGKFDFRLNSSGEDNKELASVTVWVKGPANTKVEITTDKKSYARGEAMTVSFRSLVTWERQAWIGMVPASTKHGQAADADAVDIAYTYLEKRSKGTWKCTAPNEPGKYSVRMFDAYAGKEVKAVDFSVE
jgi:hypothetical protein